MADSIPGPFFRVQNDLRKLVGAVGGAYSFGGQEGAAEWLAGLHQDFLAAAGAALAENRACYAERALPILKEGRNEQMDPESRMQLERDIERVESWRR